MTKGMRPIKNAVNTWLRAAKHSQNRTILSSPYLTSGIAEGVTSHFRPGQLDVYTLFSAEAFASGASSLKTLRKILNQGHTLFHLDRLHAKFLLVIDQTITVGSQNFTKGGTANKELSTEIQDARFLKSTAKVVESWANERVEIDHQMLAAMEVAIASMSKAYKELNQKAIDIDAKLFAESHQRKARERELVEAAEAKQQAIAKRQAEMASRIAGLSAAIRLIRKSGDSAMGVVRDVESGTSFLALNNRDLTKWKIHEREFELVRTKRYLTILENNGQLGWSRVMRTRISFVGTNVSIDDFKLEDALYSAKINALSASDTAPASNYSVTLKNSIDQEITTIHCWFDGMTNKIVSTNTPTNPTKQSVFIKQVIDANPELVSEECLRHISSPFFYKGNLTGREISSIFGPRDCYSTMRCGLIGGHPILLVKRL